MKILLGLLNPGRLSRCQLAFPFFHDKFSLSNGIKVGLVSVLQQHASNFRKFDVLLFTVWQSEYVKSPWFYYVNIYIIRTFVLICHVDCNECILILINIPINNEHVFVTSHRLFLHRSRYEGGHQSLNTKTYVWIIYDANLWLQFRHVDFRCCSGFSSSHFTFESWQLSSRLKERRVKVALAYGT